MGFFSELRNDLVRVRESFKQVDSSRLSDSKREEHNFKALRQIAARPAIGRRAEKRGVPRPPVLIVGKR